MKEYIVEFIGGDGVTEWFDGFISGLLTVYGGEMNEFWEYDQDADRGLVRLPPENVGEFARQLKIHQNDCDEGTNINVYEVY